MLAAASALRALFPAVGPWTSAILWHGLVEEPTPTTRIEPELLTIASNKLAALAVDYVLADPVRAEAVGAQVLAQLRRWSFQWASLSMQAARNIEGVLLLLEACHIEVVVTKGPGIATVYRDKGWRPYSDIDLLVRPKQFSDALRLLRSHGWVEEARNLQPRSFFSRMCQEGVNLTHHGGGSLDLHHHIPPWQWGRGVGVERVLGARQRTVSAGKALPCACVEDNALIALLHVVSDRNKPGQSLMVWRDIVELLRRSDAELLAERLRDAGLSGWCGAIVDALPTNVRPHVEGVDDRSRVRHPVRLRALLSPTVARWGVGATQFLRLPLLNGLAFAAGMALPSRQFLSVKFPGDARPLKRWWLGRKASDRP